MKEKTKENGHVISAISLHTADGMDRGTERQREREGNKISITCLHGPVTQLRLLTLKALILFSARSTPLLPSCLLL